MTEVNGVRHYVGADLLQRIWEKKAELDGVHEHGDKKEWFAIRGIRLESCSNQMEEDTQPLLEVWSSDSGDDYDSGRHHLVNMRASGNLVAWLSQRSIANGTASQDFLEELVQMEKLIDPKFHRWNTASF